MFMVHHNQEKLHNSEIYHYLTKRLVIVIGLIGAGVAIEKYLFK